MTTDEAEPPPTNAVRLRGVRARALQLESLALPLGRWTAVTGPGGSGKTTLLRDVLFAEAHRRYVETFSAAARRLMERLPPPDLDSASGLTAALFDPAEPPPPPKRETLAERAGLAEPLRRWFARHAVPLEPATGEPQIIVTPASAAAKLEETAGKRRGLVLFPWPAAGDRPADPADLRSLRFRRAVVGDATVSLDDLAEPPAGPAEVVADRVTLGVGGADRLAESLGTAFRFGGGRCTVLGEDGDGPRELDGRRWTVREFRDRPLAADGTPLPPPTAPLFDPRGRTGRCPACRGTGERKRDRGRPCPACGGTGLTPAALAHAAFGRRWPELADATVAEAAAWLDSLDHAADEELVAGLNRLAAAGLGDCSLSTRTRMLSPAARRCLSLAAIPAGGLEGLLILLDSPTLGFGPRRRAWAVGLIRELRDAGNTVVTATVDPELVAAADAAVTLPGGEVGTPAAAPADPPGDPETPAAIPSDDLPAAGLTVLVPDEADPRDTFATLERELTDRFAAAGGAGVGTTRELLVAGRGGGVRNPRSTVATHLAIFTEVREMFAATPEAKVRGFGPPAFGLGRDSAGRCPACDGTGEAVVEMQFLPDLVAPCPECGGTRYRPEALEIQVRGRSIADVLALSAEEAVPFFRGRPKPRARAAAMRDVGLGHLTLGRGLAGLSGGELQRVRLAKAAAARTAKPTLILLEHPTAGLADDDRGRVVEVLARLGKLGHAVVAFDHHPDLIAAADRVAGPPGDTPGGAP